MTLSPVFRSPEAVEALKEKGYLKALLPSLKAQRDSRRRLAQLLRDVVAREYLDAWRDAEDDVAFLQEQFFLTLFHSLFRAIGCPDERLRAYALLNQCIKGLVTAGDNLFDSEAKMALPLKLGVGPRFASIMQMLCFDQLITRVLEEDAPFFSPADRVEFRRRLLTRMALIGTLEGSEEGGVDEAPTVRQMVDRVHRVRGGELFALAFVAPSVGEKGDRVEAWRHAEEGVRHLGTAFQIVDDVTDFEFDLGRRSHNIVVAEIVHGGTVEERAALARVQAVGKAPPRGTLEEHFARSAGRVFRLAVRESEQGFRCWRELGFWFPPEDSALFVRAIAGDSGDQRVRDISQGVEVRL
jgi:hypothetical protein